MAYLKADSGLFNKVSEENNLNADDAFVIISSISKGEILSIAMQRKWGDRKTGMLTALLNQLVIIDVSGTNDMLLNAYAEIDAYSQQRHPDKRLPGSARSMSKNDLWIAATAFAANATLLTSDGDFNHLGGVFIDLKIYDPKLI